ncbi:hypothetical protein [Kitasatospora sp. McL0602]|uniref:hypothetical protein n=1 Tax=Kitasatospora sp. McL0602 TaxID=3439530 RepID=UPI003F8B8E53
MERDKIPRVIAGSSTFVTDPEDEGAEGGGPPYCHDSDSTSDADEEASSHWGQWLRPD